MIRCQLGSCSPFYLRRSCVVSATDQRPRRPHPHAPTPRCSLSRQPGAPHAPQAGGPTAQYGAFFDPPLGCFPGLFRLPRWLRRPASASSSSSSASSAASATPTARPKGPRKTGSSDDGTPSALAAGNDGPPGSATGDCCEARDQVSKTAEGLGASAAPAPGKAGVALLGGGSGGETPSAE